MIAIVIFIIVLSSITGNANLDFTWTEEWHSDWPGVLDHYDIYCGINDNEFYFVESMAGTHLDDKSGSASAPYKLLVNVLPGDKVVIKVQAMAASSGGPVSEPSDPVFVYGRPGTPVQVK